MILLTQNFICENFIFANSVKRRICDVKNSRLRHDLLTSRNDIMVSPLREDLIFTFAKIKTIAKFPNDAKSEKGDLKVDTLHPNGNCMENIDTGTELDPTRLQYLFSQVGYVCTILPAKSDSDVVFCLQLLCIKLTFTILTPIDRSLVY